MGNLEQMLNGESLDRFEVAVEAHERAKTWEELFHQEHQENGYLSQRLTEVEESMLAIVDRFDNMGWKPLGDDKTVDPKRLPLKTVKEISELCRALYTINPFVKRGIDARHSYIWGKGVSFDGVDDIADIIEVNRKRVFSPSAYEELERVLATDGNAFLAIPNDETKPVLRIPLDQIAGCVKNPDDEEEVWFYKRAWTYQKTDGRNGNMTEEDREVYYMTDAYVAQKGTSRLPKNWRGKPVESDYTMHHMAVNKQVGWVWGAPDILPVIFWAKVYKEYLEDSATLVKAYNRVAWQAKSGTAAGANAAAAQLMRPPTRDPITGEQKNVGATSVMGMGTDLQALPPTGSQVDFDKGSALASAIAAGLGVSKVVILSDPGSGNRSAAETLDGPMLKAMESRQKLHEERFLELFAHWGVKTSENAKPRQKTVEATEAAEDDKKSKSKPDFASVSWPQIESDSTKDRVAALGTLKELYLLHDDEARKEALDTMGIVPLHPYDELPEKPEVPETGVSGQFGNTQPSVIAGQGKSGGVSASGGAQSTANSARDNREKDSGK